MKILAGDIGGTNTRLACYEVVGDQFEAVVQRQFLSAEYPDFYKLLDTFLQQTGLSKQIDICSFAIAGPVDSASANVTNLPWRIESQVISERFDMTTVFLLNDFLAVGYCIPELGDEDVFSLIESESQPQPTDRDSAAIVGAGTGLGAAHTFTVNGVFSVHSSETGHCGFAPENEEQSKLLEWLRERHPHVSIELLLSGSGIFRIYTYYRDVAGMAESEATATLIKQQDPAVVITQQALTSNDTLCQKTLECFVEIYGAVAGDVALHYYPVTDVYIAGGIAPGIRQALDSEQFRVAFTSKDKMQYVMRAINVKLIIKQDVGLHGAFKYACLHLGI